MARLRTSLSTVALLALAACAAQTPPVEVTRFHLDRAIERGSIVVEAAPGGDPKSLEFGTYAAAVTRELQRIGYTPSEQLSTSLYVASVSISRDTRTGMARRSPVTIGIGGGSGGYGGGVGGGISFGLGKGGSGDVIVTQLSVQLKRRADQGIVWEGRAQAETRESAAAAQPGIAADRLAIALFGDFPGESGRTISVK